MSDYKKTTGDSIEDDAILQQLERQFKGLKYGGATGPTPHVPKAVEIGADVRTKTTGMTSGIVIADTSLQETQKESVSQNEITLGDICLFPNGEIGIFQQGGQGVPYGVFLMLQENNKVEIRGQLLDVQKPMTIGHVPTNLLSSMLASQTWDHDFIVFSLRSQEFIAYLKSIGGKGGTAPVQPVKKKTHAHVQHKAHTDQPGFGAPRAPKPLEPNEQLPQTQHSEEPKFAPPRAPKPVTEAKHKASKPANAPLESNNEGTLMVRGRQIIIRHSKISAWKAVYMGTDDLGEIFAFKTMNGWELTRVALAEYTEFVEYGEILPLEKIVAIEDYIINND